VPGRLSLDAFDLGPSRSGVVEANCDCDPPSGSIGERPAT